jgi:hypothetical protein
VCFKVTTPARQRHGAMKRVYELVWAIRVPDYEFLAGLDKVFDSLELAQRLVENEETRCGNGLSRGAQPGKVLLQVFGGNAS